MTVCWVSRGKFRNSRLWRGGSVLSESAVQKSLSATSKCLLFQQPCSFQASASLFASGSGAGTALSVLLDLAGRKIVAMRVCTSYEAGLLSVPIFRDSNRSASIGNDHVDLNGLQRTHFHYRKQRLYTTTDALLRIEPRNWSSNSIHHHNKERNTTITT